MKILGLDIGSSSVGSAWVDTDLKEIYTGVSAFPAGVEERSDKRGDPKNHVRREKRSQRRGTARRAERKLELRKKLQQWNWMPNTLEEIDEWMGLNPWYLRRKAVTEALTPQEFGRVLLHMNQRRGPSWFDEDQAATSASPESKTKQDGAPARAKRQPLKAANEALEKELRGRTFGQFMADLLDERRPLGKAIRNRNDQENNPVYEYFPSRQMLRDEFERLWQAQSGLAGPLAKQITPKRKLDLDDPTGDNVWKSRGLLWGQRNTYWDPGTLGRCDLEPTDRVCPKADMYAQEFLVLQDVNNIRIEQDGRSSRSLERQERRAVIDVLERQKTATAKTVRKALGLNKKEIKDRFTLNIEKSDSSKSVNTNWFAREIVGAVSRDTWDALPDATQEGINRAICKFDPREPADVEKFAAGAKKWWGLSDDQADALIEAWHTRPNPENRINLSRRAVKNLLPHLRIGCSVTEARQLFADDPDNGATDLQRERYDLGRYRANHATRHFLAKHPEQLPPAPKLANPVVRKAIHEVRRHVAAYMRKFGCKPDRVIVELAREARLSARVTDAITADNKRRRDERKRIQEDPEFAHIFQSMRQRQVRQAVERVLLCRSQKEVCAYSNLDTNEGRLITERQAIEGSGLEVDHLIPRSRGGGNGRSNKVLCYAATNRGKGNKTPKEWLSESDFNAMVSRFSLWKEGSKEDQRRWRNLHKDAFTMEDYRQSQLTDTAYASRQVVQWLNQVLYGSDLDDDVSKRRVFATNGRYTSLLRRNWGLFFDEKEPDITEKSRGDHRHHAIDAVVIAFSGPERLGDIARLQQDDERLRGQGKQAPRFSIPTPWGERDSFRRQVIDIIAEQVVCHRPEKRKIVGEFHKETMYGPILDKDGKLTDEFTQRISVANLTPNHLRIPEHWKTLRERLDRAKTKAEKNARRREMLNLPDVPAGKSGVVRDMWCREELRQCLAKTGLDPDKFTKTQIKGVIRSGNLRLTDGRLVKKVTLRKIFNYTVRIPRRVPHVLTHQRVIDPAPQSTRVYEAQNNHHIEIREGARGRWLGKIVSTFDAVARVRPPRDSARPALPAVDRTDNDQGRFIMSLAVGETVHMAHPDTGKPGYFVVFKLDNPSTIHFTPHWDAGKSAEDEDFRKREDVRYSAAQLQSRGIDGKPPEKVWVGPLGEVKPYVGD